MPLDRFLAVNFNSDPYGHNGQNGQNPDFAPCAGSFGHIGHIVPRAENEKQGAASAVPVTDPTFEPLPGQPFIDPKQAGFMVAYKVMTDLSECRGYPRACSKCRLLMVSGECLLGPEGGSK